MHDIKAVRADPAGFDAGLARRGLEPAAATILAQDEARRSAQTALQDRQSRRNALARDIGIAKRQGTDTAALEAEAVGLRDEMAALEAQATEAERAQKALLDVLPNILDPDVPEGRDETANTVLHQHGEAAAPAFPPKQHFEIGEALGLMDFATAAKLSGARFTVLKGALARLERALGQWMLTLHTEQHGYTEASVPLLVNDAVAYGTDKLPKFADDLFRTTDGRWLIPTAEVPLTGFAMDEIFAEADLPLRLTALTPCFRSEAGSAGRDTRGMLRQHQFCQGGAGLHHHSRAQRRRTRTHDALRRARAERPRPDLAAGVPVCRGYRLRRGAHLRPRSVAAGAGGLAGNILLLEHPRLPGAAHERPVSPEGGQGHRLPAHAERFGRGGRAGADRGARDPPAGRRLRGRSRGAATLDGRPQSDRLSGSTSVSPKAGMRKSACPRRVARCSAGSLIGSRVSLNTPKCIATEMRARSA